MFRKVVSSPSHAAMQFTGARCELGSAKATCALQQKACPNQWNWPCNNELKELVQAGFYIFEATPSAPDCTAWPCRFLAGPGRPHLSTGVLGCIVKHEAGCRQ